MTNVNLQKPKIDSKNRTKNEDLELAKHQYLFFGPSVLKAFFANSVNIPVKPKGIKALYPDFITNFKRVNKESKYLRMSKAIK